MIAARSLVPGFCASGSCRVQIDDSSSTYSRGHQSSEQMTRALAIPKSVGVRVCGLVFLPGLHSLPERVSDDLEVGDILDDPVLFGIEARDTLSSFGVLDVSQSVPDEPPDIELVDQNSGSALSVSVNSGWSPSFPGRYGNILGVEVFGD